MGNEITILAHHLSSVIARYHFLEEWDESLEFISRQYGHGMHSHIQRLTQQFFTEPAQATITINAPDSFCSPELSDMCRECLLNPGVDLPTVVGLEKYNTIETLQRSIAQRHREYQLGRAKIDKDYERLLQIRVALAEVSILLYYGLKPGSYSSSFLIERIDEIGNRIITCQTDLPTQLPSNSGFSQSPSIHQEFPNIGRLMNSGLYEDLVESVCEKDCEDERITAEELDKLKENYPTLFASVVSDGFYYDILNIISQAPAETIKQ